jgi:hypothetical protein
MRATIDAPGSGRKYVVPVHFRKSARLDLLGGFARFAPVRRLKPGSRIGRFGRNAIAACVENVKEEHMADKDKTAEEQLHDATWVWVQRLVITLVLIGAGYFIRYYQYSDSSKLRVENKEQQDQIVDLKNQRETLSTQIARHKRDFEVCRKELKELRASAKAAAE